MVDKHYILSELKRTAAQNNGVPLGKNSFLKATGIKESDWAGKYWARWSDAVAEAGLDANAFRTATDKDSVLEALALYTRELGRVPVRNELKMRRRSDSSFPGADLFQRRFGDRLNQAKLLLEFASKRTGFDDIAEICSTLLSQSKTRTLVGEDDSEVIVGEVYLFKSGKYYKIGKTNDTVRRGGELRIQLPERLDLIHSIKTDDPSGVEAYWHRRFGSKQLNGEWFDLNLADIKAFKRWKRIA